MSKHTTARILADLDGAKVIDTSRITHVTKSQWTGDIFLAYQEAPDGKWHLCDGWTLDQPYYDAVMTLIANWEEIEDDEHGCWEYRKRLEDGKHVE